MKKSKISGLFLLLFSCGLACAQAKEGKPPTEQQVQKLAAAAWKERPHSIDITFYLEWTRPPKPIEQIRREVEESFKEDIAALGENPHPVLLERTKATMERNIQRRIKIYQYPRLIKKRIRVSGPNQRVDQVIAEPGGELDPNVPFDSTYVNVGERNSPDFFSFDYEHKIKRATIKDKSGFVRRDPGRFVGMPLGIPFLLRAGLGVNEGTQTEPSFVPDPNKMQTLARTGLTTIESIAGVKLKRPLIRKISIYPDPNAPDTRDRIEFKDPNYAGGTVLICDRNDYSCVYSMKSYLPTTGKLLYMRECSNFDSQGFPHNITEIQYDKNGNFKEMSVYRIVKVELNPSIPEDAFKFQPPEDYEVEDRRPPEKRPKNVSYLTTEDVKKAFSQMHKAFQERNLTTLKEFLKHRSWRVRSLALGLITGVAEGEELKKIVESVVEDECDEVREKAERILKELQE